MAPATSDWSSVAFEARAGVGYTVAAATTVVAAVWQAAAWAWPGAPDVHDPTVAITSAISVCTVRLPATGEGQAQFYRIEERP